MPDTNEPIIEATIREIEIGRPQMIVLSTLAAYGVASLGHDLYRAVKKIRINHKAEKTEPEAAEPRRSEKA